MHASIKQNLVNHDIMNDGWRKPSSVKGNLLSGIVKKQNFWWFDACTERERGGGGRNPIGGKNPLSTSWRLPLNTFLKILFISDSDCQTAKKWSRQWIGWRPQGRPQTSWPCPRGSQEGFALSPGCTLCKNKHIINVFVLPFPIDAVTFTNIKKQVSVLVFTNCVATDTLIDQLTHAVALSEENVHMGNILL